MGRIEELENEVFENPYDMEAEARLEEALLLQEDEDG